MTRTVYVNGEYLPETEAKVSIFDRGFLFADGVYEVTSVLGGKLIDFAGHAKRLQRSLDELEMKNPISTEDLLEVHRQLVEKNGIVDGLIYLQITRGAPDDRDFAFPPADTAPTAMPRCLVNQRVTFAMSGAKNAALPSSPSCSTLTATSRPSSVSTAA